MVKEEKYITENRNETVLLAEKFSKNLKLGDRLFFYGNLGSGKTTFIQGLAKGLGIKRRIISPTFIIVRHYALEAGNFYHIDLYRTQDKLDILSLGIDEILDDKENIISVEWSEKIIDSLPEKRIEIHCKYLLENKREIIIRQYEQN